MAGVDNVVLANQRLADVSVHSSLYVAVQERCIQKRLSHEIVAPPQTVGTIAQA
jgi:hypothetical protein